MTIRMSYVFLVMTALSQALLAHSQDNLPNGTTSNATAGGFNPFTCEYTCYLQCAGSAIENMIQKVDTTKSYYAKTNTCTDLVYQTNCFFRLCLTATSYPYGLHVSGTQVKNTITAITNECYQYEDNGHVFASGIRRYSRTEIAPNHWHLGTIDSVCRPGCNCH